MGELGREIRRHEIEEPSELECPRPFEEAVEEKPAPPVRKREPVPVRTR